MGNKVNVYLSADNIISALGITTEENIAAVKEYRSGIALHKDNFISDVPVMAATVDFSRLSDTMHQLHLESFTRVEQLFILSIHNVLAQSGADPGDPDCCIIFSTTKGNIELLAKHTDIDPNEISLWRMAERVASYFGAGQNFRIISNACISGVSALIVAKRLMEEGLYKKVIVTGADVLSHFIVAGFSSFKSLSSSVCRPFDAVRDGLNLGEGCGTVLLTTDGLPGDIIVAGGGIANDANHISGPSRTGDGLYYAMRSAITDAGVSPAEIDFVNAHGTATAYNDEMECKAIHLAGLQAVPVSSFKPYFGHTLGAAGVIETILCAHQLRDNAVFGTLGFEQPGVSMPMQVQAEHDYKPVNICLKTASGFGGCNAAVVLAKQPFHGITQQTDRAEIDVVSTIEISGSEDFPHYIREAYKASGENNLKFYKMDDLSKLGYIASCRLLKDKTFLPTEAGIVAGNSNSSLDTDKRHQTLIDKDGDGAASPSVFVYTLPNVLVGEICIRHKIQGENTFFISKQTNPSELEAYARMVISKTGLKYCIVAWCELLGNRYKAVFKLLESK